MKATSRSSPSLPLPPLLPLLPLLMWLAGQQPTMVAPLSCCEARATFRG